jgi:hypothetical protein
MSHVFDEKSLADAFEKVRRLYADLAAAEARAEKAEAANREWKEDAANVLAERCAKDERHCVCVVHLRAALAKAEAALAEATKRADTLSVAARDLVARTAKAEDVAKTWETTATEALRERDKVVALSIALVAKTDEALAPLAAEKARADKASANCAALAADALRRHVETVGGCSVCDLKTGKRCALLSTTNQGAGWVSPEEHARVVALTADEALKHARGLAAERDAALAVKAQLLGALGDIADSEDENGVPSSRSWMQQRARAAIEAVARTAFRAGDRVVYVETGDEGVVESVNDPRGIFVDLGAGVGRRIFAAASIAKAKGGAT